MSRVVVTGLGLITNVGNNVPLSWEALTQGKSGIKEITGYDMSRHGVNFGGQITNFDASQYMDRKEARRNDPYEQLAIAASQEALTNSGLCVTKEIANEVGVSIGSGIGGAFTLHEQFKILFSKGPERISPFLISMTITNGAAGNVSIKTGAKGPILSVISACATGGSSIGEAWETIRRGDAKVMIAGGAEKAVTPMSMAAFENLNVLSQRNDDPQSASRPFDATRDGFVMGEGAGILILEDLQFAQARGATILAELVGYGTAGDAYHLTDIPPEGDGLVRAMQQALSKAHLCPEQVDYINAHGTSTRNNDKIETRAIKTCLGSHAYNIAVSSTKSMIGHCLGAAGAIEAAVSVMTICTGIITPTINLHYFDPECDLDYVPNKARRASVDVALSNSMGFGGHNICLAFKKYTENH